MKKIFALLLAILVVSSFSITAFAAPVDEATIDTSRTGSLDIYKYDLTNAEKDAFGTAPMSVPASRMKAAWRPCWAIPVVSPR